MKISIQSNDIPVKAIEKFVVKNFSDNSVVTTNIPSAKDENVRNGEDIIFLIFSVSTAASLITNIIYDLSKFALKELIKLGRNSPKIILILKNGTKVEIDSSLEKVEINNTIAEYVNKKQVKSIHYK
jgi:bisphosphoglycerate-independent phosphoglycerate mutase (AlkP superfamily)